MIRFSRMKVVTFCTLGFIVGIMSGYQNCGKLKVGATSLSSGGGDDIHLFRSIQLLECGHCQDGVVPDSVQAWIADVQVSADQPRIVVKGNESDLESTLFRVTYNVRNYDPENLPKVQVYIHNGLYPKVWSLGYNDSRDVDESVTVSPCQKYDGSMIYRCVANVSFSRHFTQDITKSLVSGSSGWLTNTGTSKNTSRISFKLNGSAASDHYDISPISIPVYERDASGTTIPVTAYCNENDATQLMTHAADYISVTGDPVLQEAPSHVQSLSLAGMKVELKSVGCGDANYPSTLAHLNVQSARLSSDDSFSGSMHKDGTFMGLPFLSSKTSGTASEELVGSGTSNVKGEYKIVSAGYFWKGDNLLVNPSGAYAYTPRSVPLDFKITFQANVPYITASGEIRTKALNLDKVSALGTSPADAAGPQGFITRSLNFDPGARKFSFHGKATDAAAPDAEVKYVYHITNPNNVVMNSCYNGAGPAPTVNHEFDVNCDVIAGEALPFGKYTVQVKFQGQATWTDFMTLPSDNGSSSMFDYQAVAPIIGTVSNIQVTPASVDVGSSADVKVTWDMATNAHHYSAKVKTGMSTLSASGNCDYNGSQECHFAANMRSLAAGTYDVCVTAYDSNNNGGTTTCKTSTFAVDIPPTAVLSKALNLRVNNTDPTVGPRPILNPGGSVSLSWMAPAIIPSGATVSYKAFVSTNGANSFGTECNTSGTSCPVSLGSAVVASTNAYQFCVMATASAQSTTECSDAALMNAGFYVVAPASNPPALAFNGPIIPDPTVSQNRWLIAGMSSNVPTTDVINVQYKCNNGSYAPVGFNPAPSNNGGWITVLNYDKCPSGSFTVRASYGTAMVESSPVMVPSLTLTAGGTHPAGNCDALVVSGHVSNGVPGPIRLVGTQLPDLNMVNVACTDPDGSGNFTCTYPTTYHGVANFEVQAKASIGGGAFTSASSSYPGWTCTSTTPTVRFSAPVQPDPTVSERRWLIQGTSTDVPAGGVIDVQYKCGNGSYAPVGFNPAPGGANGYWITALSYSKCTSGYFTVKASYGSATVESGPIVVPSLSLGAGTHSAADCDTLVISGHVSSVVPGPIMLSGIQLPDLNTVSGTCSTPDAGGNFTCRYTNSYHSLNSFEVQATAVLGGAFSSSQSSYSGWTCATPSPSPSPSPSPGRTITHGAVGNYAAGDRCGGNDVAYNDGSAPGYPRLFGGNFACWNGGDECSGKTVAGTNDYVHVRQTYDDGAGTCLYFGCEAPNPCVDRHPPGPQPAN